MMKNSSYGVVATRGARVVRMEIRFRQQKKAASAA